MSEALIGLASVVLGVVLGFGLSVGYQECKERRERKKLKGALIEELRANLQMLPQKRDNVQQIIAHLKKDRLLPGRSVRFLTVFYDAHFPSLFPDLSVKERNSLHLLYEYFRAVDWLMQTYTDRIVETMGTEKIHDYVQLYLAMMGDIQQLLGLTEKLAAKHLEGKPEDVFHSDEDYVKLVQAKHGRDI